MKNLLLSGYSISKLYFPAKYLYRSHYVYLESEALFTLREHKLVAPSLPTVTG